MTQNEKAAVDIARDLYLAGDFATAAKVLAEARVKLSKTHAKQIAKMLLEDGRVMEAIKLLTGVMGLDSARSELAPAVVAKVGDIVVSSWGYGQSNVDYYEVVAVSGASVTIRELGKNVILGRGTDQVTPLAGVYVGEPMKRRVSTSYEGTLSVKIDHNYAYAWDGKPDHETSAGYGH